MRCRAASAHPDCSSPGESAGLVDLARLKGVHYAIESGRLAAEAAYRSLQRGENPGRIGAFDAYDSEVRSGYLGKGLREVRNMRQAFEKGFFVGGGLASAMTVTKGKLPPKEFHNEPNAEAPLLRSDRASRYPSPDGTLTFDKLSSVFASGNRTRDDQPSHVRVESNVARDVAEMWAWMCPAQVYEVGEENDDGTVEVKLTPSNCVQCGAITARGGRLTPPEGGSGPEYTLTLRAPSDREAAGASRLAGRRSRLKGFPGVGHRNALRQRRVAAEQDVRPGGRIRIGQRRLRESDEQTRGPRQGPSSTGEPSSRPLTPSAG